MATFNPSDDALRKLVAGSRAVPDISSDDIEAALADATTKNTLSDDQVARVLGKVHRLITAASENNIPGERPVSTGQSAVSTDGHSSTEREPKLVIFPASPSTQRRVSRTAVAAFTASLLSLLCVCLLTSREPPRRVSEGERIQKTLTTVLRHQAGKYRLTAKPAPDVVEPTKVAVGDTIETHDFERRRLALPDDSVLYVNSNSSVLVRSTRSIDVTRGSIFVEVAQKPEAAKFEVITPNRTVTSLGTKFAVNFDDAETAVTVTQGRVLVSGINAPITAGQKLVVLQDERNSPASGGRQSPDKPAVAASGDSRPPLALQRKEYILTSLPSAASELEWTRDLIAAATGPLVPKSEYVGGALVTIDPNGQSSQLSLRKYHVDVHIEDGFARTTIDQTYFNHTHSRLEGTFHFPLPPDASLSRLAMYVNGKLMEGGMAERNHARNTFEEIKRKMLDPALLEWVDGSTFKMRVFPLEPRQEKRIILSYSQRLPSVDGQMTYRFPAGHTMDVVREWSAAVRIKDGDGSTWHSPSHDLKPVDSTARNDAADLLLEASEKNAMLDRDLVLTSSPASGRASALRGFLVPSPPRSGEKVADRPDEGVDARRGDQHKEPEKAKSQSPLTLALSPDGEKGQSALSKFQISNFKFESHEYLMLRLRPDLAGEMQRKPHHWVFLFEHSGDRTPLLARTQIEILRTLLNNAEHTDTFSIVKASTRATLYAEQPLPCSPENIAAAVKHLENVHLVGAMDLAAAFNSATQASGRASALRVHAPKNPPASTVPSPPRSGEKVADRPDEGFDARNSNSANEVDRSQSPLILTLSPKSGERGQETQTNPGPPLSAFRFPVLVHLGSGHTALGERDAAKLAELLPKDVPYIGIGVGKRWNPSLMNLAASRTGGLSVQINPDEDVAWRTFEVFSKLHLPRLMNVKVESGKPKAESGAASTVPSPPRSGEKVADRPDEGVDTLRANAIDEANRKNGPLTLTLSPDSGERGQGIDEPKAESGQTQELKSEISNLKSEVPDPHFLLFSDTISQGEEIAAICRVAEGQSLPKEITVTATLNGQPWSQTVAVENIKEQASYLPRHWAKLEIDRLLAENAAANRESIVALSKSMYVMSPFTSLLVLENDEMYTQFNVDRGRKDHWAMYSCPDQIPVVVENGNAIVSTDSTIDGESATSDFSTTDVRSTIVRIPPLSWPMNENGVDGLNRHPMYWRLMPLGLQKNNLWFEQNPADDFITPPHLNYFMYQGGWNFSPVQNDWGSNGLFESAYRNRLMTDYRMNGQVTPELAQLGRDLNRGPDFETLLPLIRKQTADTGDAVTTSKAASDRVYSARSMAQVLFPLVQERAVKAAELGRDHLEVQLLDVEIDMARKHFGNLTKLPPSAPGTELNTRLRQDFLYRTPRFITPPETSSHFVDPSQEMFTNDLGYFGTDPLYEYTIPLGAPTFMGRYNFGRGQEEWSPFVTHQPINRWDLGDAIFEDPLENIMDTRFGEFPSHWNVAPFTPEVRRLLLVNDSLGEATEPMSINHLLETEDRSAVERAKLNELLAYNRGSFRRGIFDNQLNSIELSAIVDGSYHLDTRSWAELTRLRERRRLEEKMLPPLERQTVASLSTKISLHVHDAEFQSAIQQLATSSGVKIVIDVPALRRVGISEKQLVNVDVDGITLKSVLNLLLDQVGDLTYLVKGDVVTIRPTLRRQQNGSAGQPLFADANAHRWNAAQPGDGASLVSLPVFGGLPSQPFVGSPAVFVDLMSHAPGLSTSTADALAVMEAEASISNLKFEISNPSTVPSPPRSGEKVAVRPDEGVDARHGDQHKEPENAKSQGPLTLALSPESGERGQNFGHVDEAARGLIEKARGRGWESITIGGSNNEPGITISYDGHGRHVWERVISEALREQVVCDGTTLWHVYRDLGLASKRPFSRFHHEDFSSLVPWLLPSADELARGADVVAVDKRTVALVSLESGKRKAESGDGNTESEISDLKSQMSQLRLHLLFDADGRLIERQWIERSQTDGVEANTTLLRITYAADGVVKVIDRDGKEQMTLNLHRAIAAEPKLVPDLNGLVVLPMPVRSPEVIHERMQADKSTMQNADLGQVGLHVARSVSDRDAQGINQEKAPVDQAASTNAATADAAVQADKTTTQNADLGQVGLHVARSVSDRDVHGVDGENAAVDQAASTNAATVDSALQADKSTMQNADLGQVGLRDADLSEDDALSLMLAYMANGNAARMIEIARARFIEKGDTRDGLYVLLSRYPSALVRAAEPAPANGTALPGFDLRPSVEGSPLRQYLRQCINWMDEPNPLMNTKDFRIDAPDGSFLKRMATARNWYVRWSSGNATKDLTQAQVQADVEQTLAFVATCQNDRIAWMILSAIKPQLSTPEQQVMFAKAMERFESQPQIGRFARQQRITTLFAAQQYEEARRLFAQWFRDQLDSGAMPVIGEELYKAYAAGAKRNESFTELIISEAKRLLETQRLMTVNLLAIQISQLGDLPLADRLMTMLIEKLNVEQRPDVSLLAIEHLRRLNDPRSAKLLDRMLELPSVSDLPQIWRFAATMAESSGHKRLAIDRMELAIQLEFATRPTTINIETVRADYTALLAKYEELINAAATLETAPPEGLAERIIQAADQWRSLDDDDTAACQTAARLLAKLHQKDMAWDYQITPLAENSGESAPWINLARQLAAQSRFEEANMAWSRAFEFESSNPEILLEHALGMRTQGRAEEAFTLLKKILDGEWQPRFSATIEKARQTHSQLMLK